MSDDLATWLRKRFINEREWYGVEVDGLTDAADRIEAQEKLIQEMREALEEIAGSHPERVGYDQTDIDEVPDLSAWEAAKKARSILSKAKSQQEGETE